MLLNGGAMKRSKVVVKIEPSGGGGGKRVGEPKKRKRRRNRKKKSDQAGGDGPPAKKIKTESTVKEITKEEGLPVADHLSKAQRKKLRKRKLHQEKMEKLAQNQFSTTTIKDEPGMQINEKGRMELSGADGPLASAGNGKENTNVKNENVVMKKRRKRGRKKRQNLISDPANVVIKDENQEKVKEENLEVKRLKKDTTENTASNEELTSGSKIKKKRHRERKKPKKLIYGSWANDHKEKIANSWKNDTEEGLLIDEGSIEVIKSPFTCCYIHNLLMADGILNGVKEELDAIELHAKNNDLYKFRQTGSLKDVTSPCISVLKRFLRTFMKDWLVHVTGIPLSDEIDIGSSRYSHTDVLLCHDDELEGRRIAYILYLVPPWDPQDGGSLDLFATDGDGQPSDIVRSITPENNSFAFFEVSPVSFHQVSEVLSRDKTRLSINGWFHGPPVPRPKRKPPPPSPLQRPLHLQETDFYAWINPMFLDMDTQKDIRQMFCKDSEINLENFLTDEAYKRLSEALKGEGLAWKLTGPPNRQRYEILSVDSMPQDVEECRQFLGCEALFLVLSQLTGLRLHHMAPVDSDDEESDKEPDPQCYVEAQRWGPGCYTLIRDDCLEGRDGLDAFLYTNVSKQWTQDLGGHVTYIAKDEDEELLTVEPQSNCLCLVYRDAKTLKFTKYINSAAKDLGAGDSHFHSFACTYYE